MTRAEAARLYSILDETIGVFREEDMSEKAMEFYNDKREEFIDLYSTEIPESYWFQGTVCLSASLIFDSIEGLHVVCSTGEAGSQKLVDEVVNPALSEAAFVISTTEESGVYGVV
jgi:hypothetical protein